MGPWPGGGLWLKSFVPPMMMIRRTSDNMPERAFSLTTRAKWCQPPPLMEVMEQSRSDMALDSMDEPGKVGGVVGFVLFCRE